MDFRQSTETNCCISDALTQLSSNIRNLPLQRPSTSNQLAEEFLHEYMSENNMNVQSFNMNELMNTNLPNEENEHQNFIIWNETFRNQQTESYNVVQVNSKARWPVPNTPQDENNSYEYFSSDITEEDGSVNFFNTHPLEELAPQQNRRDIYNYSMSNQEGNDSIYIITSEVTTPSLPPMASQIPYESSEVLDNSLSESNSAVPCTVFIGEPSYLDIDPRSKESRTFSFNLNNEANFTPILNWHPILTDSANIYEEEVVEEEVENLQESVSSPLKLASEEAFEASGTTDLTNSNNYLYYDGLAAIDVYGVEKLGNIHGKFEKFLNFVHNYVFASNESYEKYKPGMNYIYSLRDALPDEGNCMEKGIKKVKEYDIPGAIKCFEAVVVKDFSNGENLKLLGELLVMNEQFLDAIVIFEKAYTLFPHFEYYVPLLTDLYLHEHCYYQACQVMLQFLRNAPQYKHLVHSGFVLPDKKDPTISKTLLKSIQYLFIKAAQLSPHNPDYQIQSILGKLFRIDRDHQKSVDCFLSVINLDEDDKQYHWMPTCMQAAASYALADKPNKALEYLYIARDDNVRGIEADTYIGLINLHLKNYEKAGAYLVCAIRKQIQYAKDRDSDVGLLQNSWARLHLCCKLMRREDLCTAVDERDFEKLSQQFHL